jgi:general secretion pathway protein J
MRIDSAFPGRGGFTLMELLVAMAIFAIVGTLALSGYTELQRQSEYAELRLARIREVQRAVQTLGQDLAQIEPRPIREPLGRRACPPCSPATPSSTACSSPARAGATPPASPARRCSASAYRLDQDGSGAITGGARPSHQRRAHALQLLGGVRAVRFRFLNTNRNGSIAGRPGWTRGPRPRAARRRRSHARSRRLGSVARLIEVPG